VAEAMNPRSAKREISVSTAARIAKCSRDTVLRGIEEGAITARRIAPRGWWKVEHASLLRFLEPGDVKEKAQESK